jgi:hypothetical protein
MFCGAYVGIVLIALGSVTLILLGTDHTYFGGHVVAQLLRHCATNRKVAGSIPDGVIRIFH